MQRLASVDIERVRQFLEETSVPCDLSSFTSILLPAARTLIPSVITCYAQFDPSQGKIVLQELYPAVGPVKDGEALAPLLGQHPVMELWAQSGDASALRRSDLLSRAEWHKSELYQHVYGPWGCEDSMPVGLPAPPGLLACLCSERDVEFTDAELSMLQLVQPHVAQMYRSAEMMSMVGELTQSEGVHTMMLDRAGRPLVATQPAWELIEKYFPGHSAVSAPFPRPVGEWLLEELTRWERPIEIPKPPSTYVARGEAESSLTFRLLFGERTGEQVMLVMEERRAPAPPRPAPSLGLSRREEEILILVRMGKTSAEIADALFLSRRTVEKHLENIFCKLGVDNRTAAVAVAFANNDIEQFR